MTHTKEPWQEGAEGNIRIYGPDNAGEDSGLIAVVYKGRENAARIVECVNACAGINPAAIPDVVAALRKLFDEHIKRGPFDEPLGKSEQSDAINRAADALVAIQAQP